MDSSSALVTDRKFTGQTHDDIVGLYWYQSRAFDPVIGRFCAPDTIVPAPDNPQALNRYSYVFNNPLKFVDRILDSDCRNGFGGDILQPCAIDDSGQER